MSSNKKLDVLVTGGGGFIGSHLTKKLLQRGHNVVVLDKLDDYYDTGIKRRNITLCRDESAENFEFVEGSIADEDLVNDIFEEYAVEFVYHQAARAGVRSSVEQPKVYQENNVGGLLSLLEIAADHDVKRFVNASSSSVYGSPDYLPVDETHPKNPRSPYAITKLAGEHYCKIYHELHELSTVSLRYFTVYGPRMRPNMAITNFVSRCLSGDPPIIYGDGEQSRDFTYIEDIIEANVSLLSTNSADGIVLNVGSSENITINDLAEYVISETGAGVEPIHEAKRKADARHTHAEISKAQSLLDYNPSVSIREGVSRFIEWYSQNREWYEKFVT